MWTPKRAGSSTSATSKFRKLANVSCSLKISMSLSTELDRVTGTMLTQNPRQSSRRSSPSAHTNILSTNPPTDRRSGLQTCYLSNSPSELSIKRTRQPLRPSRPQREGVENSATPHVAQKFMSYIVPTAIRIADTGSASDGHTKIGEGSQKDGRGRQ